MSDDTENNDIIEDDAPEEGDTETIDRDTLGEAVGAKSGQNIDAMLNVGLNVQIVLGRTRMPIAQLLKLSRGSIIELDKRIGQPVEVVINDRLVARGDLVKLEDDRIGVSLIEIVKDYVTEG
ncbi:FliM/FliN family flagellar motor switch protein [Pseudooceanicola sp. LIPI14-2-Ac024]|uniref:FliM/FliN family flagellar motor switch protein n=1 Tax=Pseudooceanicola sp. LIPI14-2-Ac024 TaxID=3344875 RepID=UPI0035D131A1